MTAWLFGRPVHNHGIEEGLGLNCPETMAADGYPAGACMQLDEIAPPPAPVSAGPAVVHRDLTSVPDVWRLYAATEDDEGDR